MTPGIPSSSQELVFSQNDTVWTFTIITPECRFEDARPQLDLIISVGGACVHRLPALTLTERDVQFLQRALQFALDVDRGRSSRLVRAMSRPNEPGKKL